MAKLMVVDDEPLICQSFQWVFAAHDVEVVTAATVAEGWQRFENDRPDVIVLDFQLPDGSGLGLFDRIRAADPKRPVIFLTAHGTTDTAIEAMKRGAFDYLDKPFDLEPMNALLKRAFEATRLMRDPTKVADEPRPDRIVGRSPLIREVCKQIGRVAPLDETVLILGESGTGKELVARAIYQHGKRADKPFLAINCAAIPEALVETELFGHEPGAFTGAVERRIGRFEQADGGTLFLDEIGDMPPPVQAKVLRFLQDRTFERIGGRKAITAQLRILAATNHDLERLINEGRFRADLYYRLKEITIHIPPLRARTEDIPELANHFLHQFARETGRDVCGFASDVLAVLQRQPWPGNVRELRGAIKEAVLRTTGRTILAEFLPPGLAVASSATQAAASSDFSQVPIAFDLVAKIESLWKAGDMDLYDCVIRLIERELITRVLQHTHGHLGQACERLGIDRKTLRNKLNSLGIHPEKSVVPESQDET